VVAAAAGAGVGELFGLKKSDSVFFSGEADELTAGEAAAVAFVLRACFPVGEGEASVAAAGEGEAEAVVFILRVVFEAGSIGGWVVAAAEALAAGEASVAAAAFLRDFFAGEGGASAVAGEALAAGEASVAAAAFFFECLAGEAEAVGVGDWALTRQAPVRPITTKKIKDFVRMSKTLTKRQ
jgi:hypothetical protein